MSSEQLAGRLVTQRCREFTFRGCGVTPIAPPITDDCNSDVTSDVADILHRAHDVAITPNPATDIISIHFGTSKRPITAITIVDLLGIVRQTHTVTQGLGSITLSVAALPAGRYSIVCHDLASVVSAGTIIIQ